MKIYSFFDIFLTVIYRPSIYTRISFHFLIIDPHLVFLFKSENGQIWVASKRECCSVIDQIISSDRYIYIFVQIESEQIDPCKTMNCRENAYFTIKLTFTRFANSALAMAAMHEFWLRRFAERTRRQLWRRRLERSHRR